jgi:hypothetical protein
MGEVLAGIVCGYAFALFVTPFAALALIRMRVNSEWLRRTIPPETPLLAWSFILHTFWFLIFTAFGILLGLLLYGLEDSRPAGGLGSPNGAYTVVVLAIAEIAVAPLAIVVSRWRAPLLLGGAVFVATFGWAMPYLSLLGPD